jgi:hypothetical protein
MNRSIVLVGVAIILGGIALVASPIVLTGAEVFTPEQEFGIFLSPVGLLVILIGAVQANPNATTVRGTFGNPDATAERLAGSSTNNLVRERRLGFSPREAVDCRYCRSVITYDLAFCPRCARPRDCRACGRLLGMAAERTDCAGCHRVEAFCNCPRLSRPRTAPMTGPARARRT